MRAASAAGPGDDADLAGAFDRRLDQVVAAGVIGVPVRVPDLGDVPPARRRLRQHRLRDGRVDHHGLAEAGSWTSHT
jgi:hypothetical protein